MGDRMAMRCIMRAVQPVPGSWIWCKHAVPAGLQHFFNARAASVPEGPLPDGSYTIISHFTSAPCETHG